MRIIMVILLKFVKLFLAIVLNSSLIYFILLSQNLGQDELEHLHTPLGMIILSQNFLKAPHVQDLPWNGDNFLSSESGQNNLGTEGVAPHADNTPDILVSVPRDLLLQQLTQSLDQNTYHHSMVEMLQKALSDQKGGEKASHEVEAGLDARGREQGVNEE
ncbi:PREDICTED: uncharacterized protein LOC105955143 isoform X2 [Erythranthe guttata]|uniref:uncharacterized protein LOC105955143 isoform X2 n=1 Tax=Erythranthe guttata TaxID=4155 RepID=UPI00064E0548|nr:PREDICTED: uncharacterized protein LOC105955143 isoform X2 [Erythranthe guttata]|eukprot:XP_012834302.1 PREDICTED: uncharacterized protein LOC105955143 isoform X2 [Erythranthe guttata]